MSPYKLKYRVLSQSIKTGLADEIFDEYELALDKALSLFSDNKHVAMDLLLVGPMYALGDTGDRVLYKQEIFTAVYGSQGGKR